MIGEISSVVVSCPRTQGKVLRRLHESVARQPASIRRMLERLWELERTETAVSLINWTLLLWATPWSVCICTARLWRYPIVGGGARISMMPCAAQCHKDTCSFEIQITNAQPQPAESKKLIMHRHASVSLTAHRSACQGTLLSSDSDASGCPED